LDVFSWAIEAKGAQAMRNFLEDGDGSVCCHGHLSIINVSPTTDAKVDIE
jgi:hypothetical protein